MQRARIIDNSQSVCRQVNWSYTDGRTCGNFKGKCTKEDNLDLSDIDIERIKEACPDACGGCVHVNNDPPLPLLTEEKKKVGGVCWRL